MSRPVLLAVLLWAAPALAQHDAGGHGAGGHGAGGHGAGGQGAGHGAGGHDRAGAPYAGQQAREIASLSAADVAAIEAGEGWGLALAAELNGHPGPAHLLEHADALGLAPDQRAAVRAAFEAMNADARALGGALIEAEAALDAAFEAGGLEDAALSALVIEAALARGRLRARHLAAHLEVTPLLTPRQVATYARLRGYDAAHGAPAHDDR